MISPGIFATLYSSFVRTVESAMREKDMERDRFKGHVLCAGIQLAHYYLQMRRDQHGYSYASMEASIRGFSDLFARANSLYLEKKLKDMDALLSQPAQSFGRSYSEILRRPQGPFIGCEICPGKCIFRYEMAPLVYSERWDSKFKAAAESDDLVGDIKTLCLEAAEVVAPDVGQRDLIDLARCYLVQQTAAVGMKSRAALIKKVFPKNKTG
jgi:hypothetical protein